MVVVVKRAALSQNLFDLQEAFRVKHVAKRKGASDVICGGFGFASAPKRVGPGTAGHTRHHPIFGEPKTPHMVTATTNKYPEQDKPPRECKWKFRSGRKHGGNPTLQSKLSQTFSLLNAQ